MKRSVLALLALALAVPTLAQSSSSSTSLRSASSSSPSSSSGSTPHTGTAVGVLAGLSNDDISPGPAALAAAGILLGATTNIVGFRLFRPVVFLGALVAGGYLSALVVQRAAHQDNPHVVLFSWLAFGIGGLVLGGAAAFIEKLGRLTVGACAGVLLAGLLNVGIGHKIDSSDPERLLLVLQLTIGIASALAALDSVCLIVSLSFSGSVCLIYGIGYFAGSFPIGTDLAAYRTANKTEAWISAVPYAWWIYLAVFLLVLALGLYVQIIKAREHGYYDDNGKFVYAAHSDDDRESTSRRGGRGNGGGDDDDDDRKSPNHANFQNFAPYQPPATAATENQSASAYQYPSSDISYGQSNNSYGQSNNSYGQSNNSYVQNANSVGNYGNSSRSSRSGGSRPASNYPQPYTSYYTRPSAATASSQPTQPTYRQQRFTPTSPM